MAWTDAWLVPGWIATANLAEIRNQRKRVTITDDRGQMISLLVTLTNSNSFTITLVPTGESGLDPSIYFHSLSLGGGVYNAQAGIWYPMFQVASIQIVSE